MQLGMMHEEEDDVAGSGPEPGWFGFGSGLEEGVSICGVGVERSSQIKERSKSVSMMWPSDLTRTFSGFRSR